MFQPRRRRLGAGDGPAETLPGAWLWQPFALSLLVAALAALIMPRQSAFPYRFELNGFWNYASLRAPFDFEVLQPKAAVQAELDKIEAEHAPYYRLDPGVAQARKSQLKNFIEERKRVSQNDVRYEDLLRNPGRYQNYGLRLLDELFARGIAGAKLDALQKEDPNAPIFLVRNNREERLQARQVLSLNRAREILSDSLPYSPLLQPEVLLPVLESALTANVVYDDSLTVAGKNKKIAAVYSTGITVKKGEWVVKRNERITESTFKKLNSLKQRYEHPQVWQLLLGYFLLAFVVFGIYFFWLNAQFPEQWRTGKLAPVAAGLPLALLSALHVAGWVGPALSLLLPLWALPMVVRPWLEKPANWVAWALVLLLSSVALEWSAGWLAVQLVGTAVLSFFLPDFESAAWPARIKTAATAAFLQGTAAWACCLAGKVPPILHSFDSLLILVLANGLLLAGYALAKIRG